MSFKTYIKESEKIMQITAKVEEVLSGLEDVTNKLNEIQEFCTDEHTKKMLGNADLSPSIEKIKYQIQNMIVNEIIKMSSTVTGISTNNEMGQFGHME